jgi:hypothetical protein
MSEGRMSMRFQLQIGALILALSAIVHLPCLGTVSIAFGQTRVTAVRAARIKHQYPLPGARFVSPQTSIGIRSEIPFASWAIDERTVRLAGSVSGDVPFSAHLSGDRSMLFIKPVHPFVVGERIMVAVSADLSDGTSLSYSFSFETADCSMLDVDRMHYLQDEQGVNSDDVLVDSAAFPVLNITRDVGATPGKLYIANIGFGRLSNGYYLFELDEHGRVVKKQSVTGACGDFKIQSDGTLTYCDFGKSAYYRVDTNLQIVDTLRAANGYSPDIHELLCFRGGGYMLLTLASAMLPLEPYDLGRQDTARVLWNGIQEFDSSGDLIFEWRGIDHCDIRDAIHENWRDTAVHVFDYMHSNSLDITNDGNILLSSRHLDEVSKLDRVSGEFLWRIGGAHNQFTFENDTLGFTYQHAARMLPNGHVTLFDNGNWHPIPESRAIEFAIDETHKTATRIWEYRHDPPIASAAMGYVQRLSNGNTLISWGGTPTAKEWQTVTEVDPANRVLFDMSMSNGNFSYRVIKQESTLAGVAAEVHGTTFRVSVEAGYLVCSCAGTDNINVRVFDVLGHEYPANVLKIREAGRVRIPIEAMALKPGYYHCTISASASAEETKALQSRTIGLRIGP